VFSFVFSTISASLCLRFISVILLAVWGMLSLLGHAGVHALADKCGVCCHTEAMGDAHAKCCTPKKGPTQNVLHTCCASHKTSDTSEDTSSEKKSNPTHDSSRCLICDWFLKCQSQKLTFISMLTSSALEFRLPIFSSGIESARALLATSRGPPTFS
jgi:hypothetical protein